MSIFTRGFWTLVVLVVGVALAGCTSEEGSDSSSTPALAIGVGHFLQTIDATGLTIANPYSFSEDCRSTGNPAVDCETGDTTLDDYLVRISCPDSTGTTVEAIVCRDATTATTATVTCDTTIDFDGADDSSSAETDNFTFADSVTLDGVEASAACTITWQSVADDGTLGTIDSETFTATSGDDIE